jgi:hypothetical protein
MVDCWAGEPPPLIICKAKSTKGVLERIVREYLAPITATGGRSGGFIVNDPRTACREIRPVGKCTLVCKTASVGALFHLIPLEPRP